MSLPLLLICLWVIAGTLVAFLPMRLQFPPGIALILAAPLLLVWVGLVHGPLLALAGVLGFVSMFRRPLAYLLGRAFARKQEIAK